MDDENGMYIVQYRSPLHSETFPVGLETCIRKLLIIPNFRDDNKNILVATTQIIRIPY